jgi:hypothetical protein
MDAVYEGVVVTNRYMSFYGFYGFYGFYMSWYRSMVILGYA